MRTAPLPVDQVPTKAGAMLPPATPSGNSSSRIADKSVASKLDSILAGGDKSRVDYFHHDRRI